MHIKIDIGTMWLETEGFATSMPATAEVIETAVVKTPSAMVRLVPKSD